MALTVNTNVLALNAQRHAATTQDEMASAMERLASGKRINSAVDDGTGLAITARMGLRFLASLRRYVTQVTRFR